jgi:hypothetical protein
MDEPRPAAAPVNAKRLRAQRRAKRGLIATYIHGLSERHGQDAVATSSLSADAKRFPAGQ